MFGILDENGGVIDAKMFLGSTEIEGTNFIERKSPYNGLVVSRAPICTVEDAEKALVTARYASVLAKKSPLSQRIQWLEDVITNMEKEKEYFALILAKEVAKPITFARIEVERCIETIKITVMELANMSGETLATDIMPSGKKTLAYYKQEPVGVVACITPFNFPLNLVAHKIAPALGAGNAVVLKPTPEAPATAYMFAKMRRGEKINYRSYGPLREAIEAYLISSVKDIARIVTRSKSRDEDQKKKYNEMVSTLMEDYGYNEDSAEEVLTYASNNLWRDS